MKQSLITKSRRLFSFWIDKEIYEWLKVETARTGMTGSEIIRRSLKMSRDVAETFANPKAA